MAENILNLNREGLEEDIRQMKEGLEQFMEAVSKINKAVEIAPDQWKGAASTAYMSTYQELRKTLEKDVPESVSGMIDYMEGYLKEMMARDEEYASGLR